MVPLQGEGNYIRLEIIYYSVIKKLMQTILYLICGYGITSFAAFDNLTDAKIRVIEEDHDKVR